MLILFIWPVLSTSSKASAHINLEIKNIHLFICESMHSCGCLKIIADFLSVGLQTSGKQILLFCSWEHFYFGYWHFIFTERGYDTLSMIYV